MIGLLLLLLGAEGTTSPRLEPCLDVWVDSSSVAAHLLVELGAHDPGPGRVTCEDPSLVVLEAQGERWQLAIGEIAPPDRARVIALWIAEALRAGPAPAPPVEGRSPSAQTSATTLTSTPAPEPPEGVAVVAEGRLLKPLGGPALVVAVQAAAHDQGGVLRPSFGGGAWAGADADRSYFGLYLALGLTCVVYEGESFTLGPNAQLAGGGYLGEKLAPFGLLTGGLRGELRPSPGFGITVELGAGTFLPASPLVLAAVGLSLFP